MPSEPHDVGGTAGELEPGRHRLGPHVVGQRVVVRRLLRGEVGPSGGPAFTDSLGTCLSWTPGDGAGGGTCLLQPDDPAAEPVRIALGDIVSGKPVPPRPSHRLRVEPLEAQTRALALWPDLETAQVGRWLLRRSATSTARRANSVLAFGPAGVPDAYERVVEFYAGAGVVSTGSTTGGPDSTTGGPDSTTGGPDSTTGGPDSTTGGPGRPIAAVLPDSDEERLFRDRGWGPESGDADTVFQVAGVAAVRRRLRGLNTRDTDGVVLVEEAPGVVRADLEGRATGVAAYDRDWVGFRGIHVDPAYRREGLALRVMAALLEWGAEQGATTAYLQVLGDNTAALGLYERLGFSEHHRYRYLAPSTD